MLRTLLAILLAAALLPAAAILAQTPRTPVLVELFTSEGCSSCPPADALLARLDRDQPVPNADIITLGEHVDYWDSLGWHDRFSSHQFTLRQSEYTQRLRLDDSYTPQMIVDGTSQFVGNDAAHALRAIAEAARTPNIPISLSSITRDQNPQPVGLAPRGKPGNVFLPSRPTLPHSNTKPAGSRGEHSDLLVSPAQYDARYPKLRQ